jgi:hypothetical protein
MAKKRAIKKKSIKVTKSKKVSKGLSRWHAVPLKGSFMATAMLGFLISAFWVYPQSLNYGLSFMIVFALMFIASFISLTKAPVLKGEY